MDRTIEAEYIADRRTAERGDWPTLSEEAGRELARVVREAFGRDDIAV